MSECDTIFDTSRAAFVPVAPASVSDYISAAINYYDYSDFPACRLIWSKQNDWFPCEEDFEEVFIYKQPLLYRNADIKFSEAKSLAIFTSKHWIEQAKPIFYVINVDDGDWHFMTGDELTSNNIWIVALEQLVL